MRIELWHCKIPECMFTLFTDKPGPHYCHLCGRKLTRLANNRVQADASPLARLKNFVGLGLRR
jgi:hypothetical protein